MERVLVGVHGNSTRSLLASFLVVPGVYARETATRKRGAGQKNYKDNGTWDPLARDKKSKHRHAGAGGGQRKDNGLIKTDQQLQIQVMGASKHVDDG
jgi:hypothetical protein